MPDFLLKDIDSSIADRVKRLARERDWPINDVFLHLIKQALDDCNGVVARAAEKLKIRRTTLVEKMRKYDLNRV